MSFPRTTQAAILVELNKPLVIDEIQLPESLEAGQVLVHLHCTGICGSQIGEIDGAKGEDKYLPHLLGHEGSGIVEAVGAGVRYVRPGDTVVLHWRKGNGIEAVPPVYGWHGRRVNAGAVTTFNEWAVVSENRVTAIPADSNLDVAALLGCAVTTGFGVASNNANIRIGESVVVYGAGGVGLNIIQAAALSSAYPIIAVDLFDNRLELAKSLGATHLINARSDDAKQRLAELFPGGCDVFIDNTGKPEIIELGYGLTKPQGRTVLVGVPKKGANINIYSLPLHFGKSLSGSHGGETIPQVDIPRYHALYRAKRLQLDELITYTCGLGDINQAIQGMRDGSIAGRCLIKF